MKLTILPLNPAASDFDKSMTVINCGMPLLWVQQCASPLALRTFLEGKYGWPLTEMEGGAIDAEGRYSYPDDPVLEPLVKVELGLEGPIFYQYDYGFVAIVTGSTTFISRMD